MAEISVGLLDLPYDVRHLIYKHLFPPAHQIYILAGDGTLQVMDRKNPVPVSLFRVNHALYIETAEFLYNSYLFNIIGLKQECLKQYQPFIQTFAKHARQTVRIDAYSNGDHSATSCLSVQSGNTQLNTLQSRRRGKPRTIQQLEHEVKGLDRSLRLSYRSIIVISAFLVAILAILLRLHPLFR